MLTFATPLQLAKFIYGDDATEPQAPENAQMLLRHASMTVRRATRNALYQVDADGYPTDLDIKERFADATCAQAWAIDVLKSDLAVGSAANFTTATTRSLGNASITYLINDLASTYRDGIADGRYLAPLAYNTLAEAGLLDARVTDGYPAVTQVLDSRPIDLTTGRIL